MEDIENPNIYKDIGKKLKIKKKIKKFIIQKKSI